MKRVETVASGDLKKPTVSTAGDGGANQRHHRFDEILHPFFSLR
jgi:hypothetical protein